MLTLPFAVNAVGPLLKIQDVVQLCESSKDICIAWSRFLKLYAKWTWQKLEDQYSLKNYSHSYDTIQNVSISKIGSELRDLYFQKGAVGVQRENHFRKMLSALPSQVKHLNLEGVITERISTGWLPPTLISLRLYLQRNSLYTKDITVDLSMENHFQSDILHNNALPRSLTSLEIKFEHAWSEGEQASFLSLLFEPNFLPNSLKILNINMSFYMLGSSYQTKFKLLKLPPNLMELHIDLLPCLLKNIVWPPELKILCMKDFPNQNLTVEAFNFPTSLQTLTLGGWIEHGSFYNWDPKIFPQSLRVLNIDAPHLKSALQRGVLPLQLEELKSNIPGPYPFDSKDIVYFPSNLKKISLPYFFGKIQRNALPKSLVYFEIGFTPSRYKEFKKIILPETTILKLVFTFWDLGSLKQFKKIKFPYAELHVLYYSYSTRGYAVRLE